MPDQALIECYQEFVSLTTRIGDAIGRRDLDEIFRLESETTRLTGEIERIFRICEPLLSGSSASMTEGAYPLNAGELEALIRKAMTRVQENSDQVRQWLAESEAGLVRLQRGAAAIQRYSHPGRNGSLFFEQEI